MVNKQRNRLVHSNYDPSIGKHIIFVYNVNHDVVAHLMVSPNGCIEVFKGTIDSLYPKVNEETKQ